VVPNLTPCQARRGHGSIKIAIEARKRKKDE
jgi:hypothetical protein